jgi:hypothetical protein
MLRPNSFGVLEFGFCNLYTYTFGNIYTQLRLSQNSSCTRPSETQILRQSVCVSVNVYRVLESSISWGLLVIIEYNEFIYVIS